MRANGPDPHTILGVAPGATAAEVKRAYRALAKRHHPDAGQGSVIRFLEVQAAYEALIGSAAPGGAPRRGRRTAQPGAPGGAGTGARDTDARSGPAAGAPPGSDWARRPAGARPRPPGSGAGPGGRRSGAAGSRTQAPGAAGSARDQGGAGRPSGGSSEPEGGTRGRRRATLGSTSYDGAEDVFEPDWYGASWYGTSSGTYWTVNPKEYADPRKHGPEYQARGRRAPGSPPGSADGTPPESADRTPPGSADGARPEATDPLPDAPDGGPSPPADEPSPGARPGRSTPSDLPPAWRSHSWTAAGPSGDSPPVFEHDPAPGEPVARGDNSPPAPGRGPASEAAAAPAPAAPPLPPARPPGPGILMRVALAVLGWGVPGLAVAALAGLPGGFTATLPLQVGIVALLAAAPRLAWAAAGAGLAVVFAGIPIVALVAALGGPVVPGEPVPVAVVLAVFAWVGGLMAVGSGRVAPFPWRLGG